MNRLIKVGTRGSKLALKQTNLVIEKIQNKFPEIKFEIISIKTKGDQVHHKPLREVFEDGKSAFTSEIQKSLKDKNIDIAVHSMKDVAGNVKEKNLCFGAFLERGAVEDVIILKNSDYKKIESLPESYVIGTVSARRKASIHRINKNLIVKNLRGNVQTRIAKLKNEYVWEGHKKLEYDAILMAKCAIERSGEDLDLGGLYYFDIAVDKMIPAAGQGIIGVECRKNDIEIYSILREINHHQTELEAIAEREFLYELGGNCHTVIGVYAKQNSQDINILAEISDEQGDNLFSFNKNYSGNPEDIGKKAAVEFRDYIVQKNSEILEILNIKKPLI